MERSQKEAVVGSIKATFDRMSSAVFLDFKGLNVAVVSKLRDEFRKSGVEYKVVKNTLVKHALKQHAWAKNLDKSLVGMTGVAFSFEDPSAAAKVVKAFRKDPATTSSRSRRASSTGRSSPATPSRPSSRPCPGRTSSARCSWRRCRRR
jgi:large subunit ribosomal protein L10